MATNNNCTLPVTVKVVPGTTAITAMFANSLPVKSALIQPLASNTAVTAIAFDWGATPLNTAPLEITPTVNGKYYDLLSLNIIAGNSTDGVLITYFND